MIILRELPLAVRLVCARRVTPRAVDNYSSAGVQTSPPPPPLGAPGVNTGGEKLASTAPLMKVCLWEVICLFRLDLGNFEIDK